MKKIYFRYLYVRHLALKLFGLTKSNIIKIWYDVDKQDVFMFVDGRSGMFHLPASRRGEGEGTGGIYSLWLADIEELNSIGMMGGKKKKTVYTLHTIRKWDVKN